MLSQNTNDFSKNSWDYEKNSIYGVHVKNSDYSFGVVPVPETNENPYKHNNDPNLHMRFNEVDGVMTSQKPWMTVENSYDTSDYYEANNHLRFNEVENENEDLDTVQTWHDKSHDYIDNTIHWSPYGDVSDYPNNQAKSKVRLRELLLYMGFCEFRES